jgi:hypothetical protein
MRNKGTLLAAVITLAVITGLVSSVNAVDSSLWTSGGVIKKQLLVANVQDYNSEKYCKVEEKYEIFYRVTWPTKAFSYRYPVTACWYNTNIGEVGTTGGRIYFNSPNGENVIRTSDVSYNMFYPLGQNDKMAMTANNGTSFFRNLFIYDNLESRLTLSTSSNAELYSFNRQNGWRLNDSSGNGLNMNHMDQSQNGDWLIVEGINGFMRVNTKTKEILTFESPQYGYGSGTNPTYQLTISNSGRYAIISGGNISSRVTYIYDLESCQIIAGQPLQMASGCGKRNLKGDAFPALTTMQALSRTIFSADETNITVDVPGGNPVNRYVITSPLAEPNYMDYLALGDSYSSGEGEYQNEFYKKGTDGDGEHQTTWAAGISEFPYSIEKCHLSTRSYPHLLSLSAGLSDDQFHSVACSGSKANDVVNSDSKDQISRRYNGKFNQYINVSNPDALILSKNMAATNFVPGRAAQIEFVQKYKPKVASIGIGGNDIDFAGKIKSCIIPMSCSWATDLRYTSAKQIQTELYGSLDDLYTKLKSASNTTTFVAVGYPNVISEDDDSCAPNVLLNAVERRYASEIVSYMNATIKAAAAKHNIKYLDISESLQGDRLCDESYDGKAVQALSVGDDYGVPVLVPTLSGMKQYYVGFGAESYHPTHIGHEMIAASISEKLGSSSIANYDPCPDKNYAICFEGVSKSAPSIPPYFSEYAQYQPEYVTEVTTFEGAIGIDENEAVGTGKSADLLAPINNASQEIKLAPNQSVPVTMHSTPQQVGTMTVGTDGQVRGSIIIPADAEPGPHTLVINAKDSLYRDMTMYQQIFVYDTLEDFDGDGVLNTDEKCGMFEPINQDEDRDGLDDACDGIIGGEPDTTVPTITANLNSQPNDAGWFKDDVTVTWSISDDIDTELVAPAGLVANKEGEHVYTSNEVCDVAGNCATGSVTIKIDKTSPVVAATFNDMPNQNGWFNHDVTIDWLATDNHSTVTNPGPVHATQEGQHTYDSEDVCDAAGNCAKGTVTLKIDKTSPTLTSLSFSKNPKSVSENSQLSATINDDHGIERAEYFIGETGNLGQDASMELDGSQATTVFGIDFSTGVYKISVRAQDIAGNWSSAVSDYLVVYDPSSGLRIHGARMVDLATEDNQLPWVTEQPVQGKFAFSVRYGSDGNIVPQSDFQFAYVAGSQCGAKQAQCRKLELNTTQINWLTTTGSNQEIGTFSGKAKLKVDGAEQPVSFVVNARDGVRAGPVSNDAFALTVYDGENPYSSPLLYFVLQTETDRGNIKIKQ